MHKAQIVTMASLLLVAGASRAEEPPQLAPQVRALQDCRSKADAAARLACYDKAVDTLIAATTARDVVVIDKAEVKSARKGLFGFQLPKIPFLSGREGNAEDAKDESELTTTIVSARRWNKVYWRFTVEGGALWETLEDKRYFNDPKPGATVTFERGTLGAFYAKVGRGGRVQAHRIK